MAANQPAPFVDVNLFASDQVLGQVLKAQGLDGGAHGLPVFGAVAGSAEAAMLARQANDDPPRLHAYDRIGEHLDEVEYHPAYHRLMALSRGPRSPPAAGRSGR